MSGQQDKKEDFEWAQRGKDLENIAKVVKAWADQLIAADLETCLKQLRAILDGYIERCSAPNDVKEKYQKKS